MNTQELHNSIALGEGLTTEFERSGTPATQRGQIAYGDQAPHKSPPQSPPKSPPKWSGSRRRFTAMAAPGAPRINPERYRLTELGRRLSDR